MRRLLLALLAVICAAGLGLVALIAIGAWQLHSRAPPSVIEDEGLARLRADRDRLAGLALFPVGTSSDAGPTLNAQMRFANLSTPGAAWNTPEAQERLRTWRSTWLENVADVDDVDTSLLAALTTFDHWDIWASGPLTVWMAANPAETTLAAPSPEWIDLWALGQVRLAQGVHCRDPLPALQEVRHLAVLLYSTESLVAEMVALALLQSEREAAERAVADGSLAPDAWSSLSEADQATLRDVLFAMVAVYGIHAPPQVADSFGPGLGTCAAVGENIDVNALVRPLFDPPGVFGNRYVEPMHALGNRLEGSPCRLTRARAVWAHPEWGRAQMDELLAQDFGEENLTLLPFWRELIGEKLLSVASPSYGTAYGLGTQL
jgi:hypothetical protein